MITLKNSNGLEIKDFYDFLSKIKTDNGKYIKLYNLRFTHEIIDFSKCESISNYQCIEFVNCSFTNSSIYGTPIFHPIHFSQCDFTYVLFYEIKMSLHMEYSSLNNINFYYVHLTPESEFYKCKMNNIHVKYSNFEQVKFLYSKVSNLEHLSTLGLAEICPPGSFLGYKIIYTKAKRPCLATLTIPNSARRSNSTSRQCRCDKAIVSDIRLLDSSLKPGRSIRKGYSVIFPDFIYRKGKEVTANYFDPNRWNEYAPGIHFFLTEEEAILWQKSIL